MVRPIPPEHDDNFEGLSPTQRMAMAIKCTEEALELAEDPENYVEAEELLAEALELAPGDETILNNYVGFCSEVAGQCFDDGEDDKAIHFLTCIIEHVPNDAEAWMDLGTAFARKNMPMEALQSWGRCLESVHKRHPAYADCMETIGENVLIIAKATDSKVTIKEDKAPLRAAIAKLIVTLKVEE